LSRLVPVALFCAIVVFAVDPPLVFLALQERAARAAELARRADPSPELAAFLAGVRARTRRGDSIVLLLPARDRAMYERDYFRASYHLAGRSVLPMTRDAMRRADYVAAWRVGVPGESLWQGHGGALMRRR
jgi:hypothetical protein